MTIEDKFARIKQLEKLGYNTPHVMRIPFGTRIDKKWELQMTSFAGDRKIMTVRTYHPYDEELYPNGPFFLGLPLEVALRRVKENVAKWNVLWQEAVDVNETEVTGAIEISGSGSGRYDIRRGATFVRATFLEPHESISFQSWRVISDATMRKVVYTLKDITRRLGFSRHESVIVEFALQKSPVGLRKNELILWEWRKRDTRPPVVDKDNSKARPRGFVRRTDPDIVGLDIRRLPKVEGHRNLDYLLGGKASNLHRMLSSGFRIPPAFVLTSKVFHNTRRHEFSHVEDRLLSREALKKALQGLEESSKASRGDRPLLVSVRSSPVVSMPGILLTILNVGLNLDSLAKMQDSTGNRPFCCDLVDGFVQSFGGALGYGGNDAQVNKLIAGMREGFGSPSQTLSAILSRFDSLGLRIPSELVDQVELAIRIVRDSWYERGAKMYRQQHAISRETGMAVIVQQMVFGNLDSKSGAGVGFSRDPVSGVNRLRIEYMPRAQGEALVSGRETPKSVRFLERHFPSLATSITREAKSLEKLFSDWQDFEFVIEHNRLYFLQSRTGSAEKHARVRIEHDLALEGVISESVARSRTQDVDSRDLMIRKLEVPMGVRPIAKGVVASDGAAVGVLALTHQMASKIRNSGNEGILVKDSFTPDDYAFLSLVDGIVTKKGGVTSHSAILARQNSVVLVVGCKDMTFAGGNEVNFRRKTLRQGDTISLDGNTGKAYTGSLRYGKPTLRAGITADVLEWFRNLREGR